MLARRRHISTGVSISGILRSPLRPGCKRSFLVTSVQLSFSRSILTDIEAMPCLISSTGLRELMGYLHFEP